MISQSDLAIIVLAAGSSTRMGEAKQLLKWNGQTLLSNAIDSARILSPDKTLVVLGSDHERIADAIQELQVDKVINEHWKSGMGSSISVGVTFVLNNWPAVSKVIIMLADQPLIDSDHLFKLIDLYKRSACDLAATSYGDRPGVPAIFSSRYFDNLIELNSDFGARQLLRKECRLGCMISAEGKTVDLDTKEDYEKFKNTNHRS